MCMFWTENNIRNLGNLVREKFKASQKASPMILSANFLSRLQ